MTKQGKKRQYIRSRKVTSSDPQLYDILADLAEAVLIDWNVTVKRTEQRTAFSVCFNSLPGYNGEGKERFVVHPYHNEIDIFNDEHVWPANILAELYKQETKNDFLINSEHGDYEKLKKLGY